jgi:hypothetical protein
MPSAILVNVHHDAVCHPRMRNTPAPRRRSPHARTHCTGEIDSLRERLRAMEAREKEREEEMTRLKRSLRSKEISVLAGQQA